MTREQLLSNKEKLEKGLTNSNLTDAQKALAKSRLTQIEAKLAEMDGATAHSVGAPADLPSEDPKEDAPEASETSKEPAEKRKPKEKKKITAENKTIAVSDCDEKVEAAIKLLQGDNPTKPKKPARPATKKRSSEILSHGFAAVFVRAVKTQLTLNKVDKLKLAKLREARDKMVESLRALRIGFGGAIANDNEAFLEDFKVEVNKIFDEVEEKQKKAEEVKQAA